MARKDILEKVKKARAQAEQRVQENNRKAMEAAQKEGKSYSPSATTVSEYRNKRQQATKWYSGNEPTEVETLAQIMRLGNVNDEKGRTAYDLYQKSKEQGYWSETYGSATSPYAEALGVDPSLINDEFFDANAHLFSAGVHTSTGGLSSAKRNGPEALMAYNLSGLYEDYKTTKKLQAEEDMIVREAKYWMNKGLTDDEIKQKLGIGVEGGKYTGINSAIERSRSGEFTPTTAPIWAATSWGVDGMLWSIRNPEQSTGDYFTDAVKREMGYGAPSRRANANEIARRTPGNAAWAPYSNGTTMDDEAILFGVQSFDDKWIEDNRSRILSSGTEAERKAFANIVQAEESTKLAEQQAALFKQDVEAAINAGISPDEIFSEGFLDDEDYSELKKMYTGIQTGKPYQLNRTVDFDLHQLQQQAIDSWNKKNGTLSTDEYEAGLAEATGGTHVPDEIKNETNANWDFNTDVLMHQYIPLETSKEQLSGRLTASAGFSDVSVKTGQLITTGTGGAEQMNAAKKKAALSFASENIYDAWDAISGERSALELLPDASRQTIEEMFGEGGYAGAVPTVDDVYGLMAGMPATVDPVQMQQDYMSVASDIASGGNISDALPPTQEFIRKYMPGWEEERLPTQDEVFAAMQNTGPTPEDVWNQWASVSNDVDSAAAEAERLSVEKAAGEKLLAEIEDELAAAYGGKDNEQYRSAVATYQVGYKFRGGVPVTRSAYDQMQQFTLQGGFPGVDNDAYFSAVRGSNAKEILSTQAFIENAQMVGLPAEVIDNAQRYLVEIQKQNELLKTHELSKNADYESVVSAFDAANKPAGDVLASADAILSGSREEAILMAVVDPETSRDIAVRAAGSKAQNVRAMEMEDITAFASVMTADEQSNYKYIYGKYGAEKAAQYFDALSPNLEVRFVEQEQKDIAEFAGQNFGTAALTTAASIAVTPLEVLSAAENLMGSVAGNELNPYGDTFALSRFKSATRTGVKDSVAELFGEEGKAGSEVFNFLYDAFTSAMDSTVAAASGSPAAASLIMAAGSFNSSMMDASMRGASDEQALRYGLASAIVEAGTERIPLDNLINAFASGGKEGVKGLADAVVKNFAAEFSGEALSEAFGTLADDLIMQAMSGREAAIQSYMEAGLTQAEAEAQFARDALTDVIYAGALGGVSGAGSAAVMYTAGAIFGSGDTQDNAPAAPGTPEERAVAAIASANTTGVGEVQKAGTVTGALETLGMSHEEASATAKEVVAGGSPVRLNTVQKLLEGAKEKAGDVLKGIAMAVNAKNSECAKAITGFIENAQIPQKIEQLIEAYKADQQNQQTMAEYQTAVDQSTEADIITEMLTQTEPVDHSAVDAASAKVTEAEAKRDEAQAELTAAREAKTEANATFRANPADQTAADRAKAAIQAEKKAAEKARAANQALTAAKAVLKKASGDFAAAKEKILNEVREAAKVELANRKAKTEQAAQEQAEAAEAKRQSDNVLALQADDFVNTYFGAAPDDVKAEVRKRYMTYTGKTQNVTRDMATFAGWMSKKFGFSITFTDSRGLFGGAYTGGNNIVLDKNATQGDVIKRVLIEEITHAAESSKHYDELAEAVLAAYYNGDTARQDKDLNDLAKLYKDQAGQSGKDQNGRDIAYTELVSKRLAEMLSGNQEAINRLVESKPNVATRIWRAIKDFIGKLTGVKDPELDKLMNLEKMLEKALGSRSETGNVRFDIDILDKYTPKSYTQYGWARVNEILTSRENNTFQTKVWELGRRKDFKTADGFFFFDVGDGFGVNNTIIISDGKKTDPSIERVYRIRLDSETDIEEVRDFIHDAEKKLGSRAHKYVTHSYGEELVGASRRQDSPAYEELQRSGQRRLGSEDQGDFGLLENGRRGADRNNNTGVTRFQLLEPVEETRNLLAIHNLTEENLRAALELGGVPDNISDDLRTQLEEIGVPVVGYKAGNDNDRLSKLNSNPQVTSARFSLPSDDILDQQIARHQSQMNQTMDEVIPSDGKPQQTTHGTGERQFAGQTIQNSAVVPDWVKREFLRPDELNYEEDTNREQVERAWQRIQENGYEAERDRLLGLDRYSADDTAEANLMMAMALREETADPATFMMLASHYNKEGTKAGQELQARKLFTRMSPTGARVWAAGQMESQLEEHMRTHQPQRRQIDERAAQVADQIRDMQSGDELLRLNAGGDFTIDESNNRYGIPLNEQQLALIDLFGLSNVTRPGIFYNRATREQRMLEAIISTPNPLEVTGLGLNLIQRLEYMRNGVAVITNADLNYIGTQLGQFVAAGGDTGGREADLAVSRAYEAYGNITPTTLREKLRTWRYVSMLLSVPSALRNVIGNTAQNVSNATAHGLAVEIDKAIARATGQRTVEHLSFDERVNGWRGFVEETKNTFRDYFVDRSITQRGNNKYNTHQRGRVYQTQFIETARNLEGFLMSFGDRNFWRRAYLNSMAEQQKLADQNLLFNDDGTARTHEQMVEQAEADANYATFTENNQLSRILGQLKQIPGIGEVVDFIMPFTGVPANITRRMIQYSPIGLATTALHHGYRAATRQNFNQRAFVDGLSRGLTGTAMFGIGMLLAGANVIKPGTGDEDDDKKYGLKTAMGGQYTPYVYNPLTDEYVSLAAFAPAASPLTMGMAAYSEFKENEDALQALINASFGGLDQIFDASYMSGVQDVFRGYGSPAENITNAVFSNAVSQSVPALFTQLSNAMDPYVRDTKDKNAIVQALKSGLINRIPGLRQQMLPEKVDVTGQPVRTKEGLRNFFDPFTTTDARNEPIVDELLRLSEVLGTSTMLPSDALSGSKNTLTINGQKVTVDGEGKETYRKRYGELWMDGGITLDKKGRKRSVQGVRELVESRHYQRMDDEEKAEAIKDILSAAKTGAAMEALQTYGTVVEKE